MSNKTKAGPISAGRLKSFVERIENLREEKDAIGQDERDVFAEAKGVGYDTKTVRWLLSERKLDAADRDERDALRDTYAVALGMAVDLVRGGGLSLRDAAKQAGVSKSSVHRALAVPEVSQPAPAGSSEEIGHNSKPACILPLPDAWKEITAARDAFEAEPRSPAIGPSDLAPPEPVVGLCIHWTGATNRKGYGVRKWLGRTEYAHRVAWIEKYGSIPEGEMVCHRCDNPVCINPDHLFLGSNADNVADKVAKGRQSRGEDHGEAVLTEDQAREILAAAGTHDEIAAQYGVSRPTVSLIKSGGKWKHLQTGNEGRAGERGTEEDLGSPAGAASLVPEQAGPPATEIARPDGQAGDGGETAATRCRPSPTVPAAGGSHEPRLTPEPEVARVAPPVTAPVYVAVVEMAGELVLTNELGAVAEAQPPRVAAPSETVDWDEIIASQPAQLRRVPA